MIDNNYENKQNNLQLYKYKYKYKYKYNRIINNHINNRIDPLLYKSIILFLNSLSIGVLVTNLNDKPLNSIEKDREILSIAFLLLFICKLEYMGLL